MTGSASDALPGPGQAWALAAFSAAALVCLYVSTVPLGGIDFWLQAKIGNLIVAQKAIPHTLLFPFTEVAEQTFNAHEWLCSVLFYGLLSGLGAGLMPVVTAVLGLSYFLLALRLGALRSGSNMAIALLGGMAAIATQNYRQILRPELISLVLMAAYWVALEQFRQCPNRKAGAAAVVLTIVWEGVHGSFILAPVMATLYALGLHLDNLVRARHLRAAPSPQVLACVALCVAVWLACLVNPFGWELLRFVLGFGNEAKDGYALLEWTPTLSARNLDNPGFWLGALAWVVTFAVMVWNWRTLRVLDGLIFLFFSLLAAKAIRFPIYLGLVGAYICSAYVPQRFLERRWQNTLHQVCLLMALAALGASLAYGNASGQFPTSPGMWRLSDGMAHTLSDSRYRGNVFNSMELGAELTYWAYPRLRPSIDCRVDSYGLDYVRFQKALLVDDALLLEFLDRYEVRYLLLERARINQLSAAGVWRADRWRLIYQDQFAAFMQRVDMKN